MALAIAIEMPSGDHISLPARYRLRDDVDGRCGDLWELYAECGCCYCARKLWPCQRHVNARNPKPHRLT